MAYKKTFVLIAKMMTVHTIIVVTFIILWKLFKIDVKNAFLNDDLHEDIYMTPLLGIAYRSGEFFLLQKAL